MLGSPGNAAFAALSARSQAGLDSHYAIIETALVERYDQALTARLDLRCRELWALYAQGLKEHTKIPKFKSGDNVPKRVEDLFT